MLAGEISMTPQEIQSFLAEAKAVCDRATPEPWGHGIVGNGWGFVEMPTAKALCESNGQNVAPNMLWEDAQFVHHARTALPRALEIIEEMAKVKEAAEAWEADRIENYEGEYDKINTTEQALIDALHSRGPNP